MPFRAAGLAGLAALVPSAPPARTVAGVDVPEESAVERRGPDGAAGGIAVGRRADWAGPGSLVCSAP
jgi:hypothetical protein